MIRIFTLGIACLTGIGGVTAVKNLPSRTPAAEVVVADVVYPVAVGTRADRLPVSVETSPTVNESEPAAPTAELAITQQPPPSGPRQHAAAARTETTASNRGQALDPQIYVSAAAKSIGATV